MFTCPDNQILFSAYGQVCIVIPTSKFLPSSTFFAIKTLGYLLSKRVTVVEEQHMVAIPWKHLQKQGGVKCD